MKKGFTLSELLIALAIVGIIATLTVPVLIGNVHDRIYANQVKNMVATLEELAQDELISNKTRDLSNTDFGDVAKLLSDDHFSIAKSCSPSNLSDCWGSGSYKNIAKTTISIPSANTVILKNGVIMSYDLESNEDKTTGKFVIDINGTDKPNIAGRDLFAFYITPKGKIIDIGDLQNEEVSLEDKISKCTSETNAQYWCYGALVSNGWEVNY